VQYRNERNEDAFVRIFAKRETEAEAEARWARISKSSKSPFQPAAQPSDLGDKVMDFGEGKVMTLAELVDSAMEKFDTVYTFDRRLSGSYIFLNGTIDASSLEDVLVAFTTINPLRPRKVDPRTDEEAMKALQRSLLGKQDLSRFGELGAAWGDFMDGKTMKVNDLLGRSTDARLLRPDTDRKVTGRLVGSLSLSLQIFGLVPIPGTDRTEKGFAGGVPFFIGDFGAGT
jgi:hypothetical protein